jgi:hypothetical protein
MSETNVHVGLKIDKETGLVLGVKRVLEVSDINDPQADESEESGFGAHPINRKDKGNE